MEKYHNYPSIVYAGFWIRFFAYCTDLIMIGSLNRMLLFFLEEGRVKTIASLGVFLLYFLLMTKLNNGQTIGKIIFGLRLVSFSQEKLSWTTVVVREIFGRYLLKSYAIIYLITAFSEKKQHGIDMLLDTTVISENSLQLYKEIPINIGEEVKREELAAY